MELDLTAGNLAPPEVLNQIFEIVAAPLADFADPAAAEAAHTTLRAASLVCKRWHEVTPSFLEPHIHLPWTDPQLESYTSRPRCPATTVRVLQVPREDAASARLLKSFESLAGVRRVYIDASDYLDRYRWLPMVLRCASLYGAKELRITGGLSGHWVDPSLPPYEFRLERLSLPHLDRIPPGLLELLVPFGNRSLDYLELYSECPRRRSYPDTDLGHVRHLSASPRIQGSGDSPFLDLSQFDALTSLAFHCRSGNHPSAWAFTAMLRIQIATLPDSATLDRLELPIGATANIPQFLAHLIHPSFTKLKELRLPHLSRWVLESKEHGRALLEACEGRGITVVLREDFAK